MIRSTPLRGRQLLALMMLEVACAAGGASGSSVVARPVHWDPDYLIPDFVQVNKALPASLGESMRATWVDGPVVVLDHGGQSETRAVKSCEDLLNIRREIRAVKPPTRDPDLMALEATCGALQRSLRLKPSKVSRIPTSARRLAQLLDGVTWPSVSAEEGRLLQSLGTAKLEACASEIDCGFATATHVLSVAIAATGDWNDDGTEDAILLISYRRSESRSSATIGVVLSVQDPGQRGNILDKW